MTVICAHCGGDAVLHLTSERFYYGRNFGPVWRCDPCDALVGCHKGTTNAKGHPAKKYLRRLRSRAHFAFDPIWQGKHMPRGDAYAWLGDQLGIPPEQAHISMMDAEQCLLTETVSEWWRERYSPSTSTP